MARKCYTAEQIIGNLRQAEVMVVTNSKHGHPNGG